VAKPKIDELLVASALDPSLCRRLVESPDDVFADYDLTEYEMDILRRPDHRLLPLLGEALARQSNRCRAGDGPGEVSHAVSDASSPPTAIEGRTLPDTLMALTVVPCAVHEDGKFRGISYAVWVSPLPEGTDPASMPPPAQQALPGQPLTALHAVVQISAVQSQDAAGNLQMGLWTALRQSTNVQARVPPESAGDPQASPFGSALESAPVLAAVAAVRSAPREERYDRLVDLLRTLRQGDVR
jgi:hypothetical protein